ncbi:uncharacterized protein BO95DRAFT_364773 [Aspergillus brunneoviolaceus CBS 621.78]|uniref:Uncharacterized protein n=1 Tax=Aspergillus brunneoviolaceus CBS 621.78 TaxID=1450534 RepID=A0ACD1G736_9EURO|nr:hypothetical protein BO95DRAFT_364773 [Aspergillus brunneoviolaceus CBS 621.78]RAH45043.1 hypothetical protein BO95DRAFT_364773 [Aspergillus brunneoviolaceus CBS 621.78]
MPCFKGLAVSIHTPDGPISEYSIQRQSRASRIACYIPVPPPKLPDSGSGRPEQSTFAISITLLNPGQDVPYSAPKPTPDNPAPRPKVVGGLPGPTEERGQYSSMVIPYKPLTNSPNETVAAYIYFDGRQKEEVATLLRRGEETWVNSRWVSVPDSEGGGLAEREFLFREVGLERWLNGLDLEGKDAAAKIERRRQKMEKRRLKREESGGMDTDTKSRKERDIMRYGDNSKSPLEDVSDDDMSFSDSDDDPIPESAGQIKVALFRVLASGEVKRGEYSPQFDAHDDDDDVSGGNDNNNGASDANVDHTTSFAKPKTLDPKTISTQTVTSIDASDKPYATFTFMYRGERQLQKMGILKDAKAQETPGSVKRRSIQPDFSNLGPLKPGGTVGFLKFRESTENHKRGKKGSKTVGDDDMDSDDDDENSILGKADAEEGKDDDVHLSPEDLRQQGELAESIRKIKLKRQHSSASLATNTPPTDTGSPRAPGESAPSSNLSTTPPIVPPSTAAAEAPKPAANAVDGQFIGSPLKKQRASVSQADEDVMRRRMESGLSHEISNDNPPNPTGTTAASTGVNHPPHDSMATEEEEL